MKKKIEVNFEPVEVEPQLKPAPIQFTLRELSYLQSRCALDYHLVTDEISREIIESLYNKIFNTLRDVLIAGEEKGLF